MDVEQVPFFRCFQPLSYIYILILLGQHQCAILKAFTWILKIIWVKSWKLGQNNDRDQSSNPCLCNTANDDKFSGGSSFIPQCHFKIQKYICFIFFAISQFEFMAYFNVLIIIKNAYNICFYRKVKIWYLEYSKKLGSSLLRKSMPCRNGARAEAKSENFRKYFSMNRIKEYKKFQIMSNSFQPLSTVRTCGKPDGSQDLRIFVTPRVKLW